MPDTDSRTSGLEESVDGLSRSIDAACDTIDSLRAQRDELLAALLEARRVIRIWHGLGMSDAEPHAWDLYQASPEMQRINAVIAKHEGRS